MSLIRYVTRIHFADRAMEDALPEELRARGLRAPLILADADAGAVLPRLLDCLPPAARPRIIEIDARAGADAPALMADHDGCDLIIGLGGAEAMDMARTARPPDPTPGATSRRARHPEPMPFIAIPTLPGCLGLGLVRPRSAGSGLTGSAALAPVPSVLFCDPWLMRYAAPGRLAVSGMDALVHCLEALLSTAWNPPADGMAFDGLRRAGIWLERLYADPGDAEARREVMAAALNGELAAQKGFGAVHALAHAFETLAVGRDGHGGLHAALVGPALAFNAPAVPGRIAQAAEALQLADPMMLAPHLQALGGRLGLPVALGHLGLIPERIAHLATAAAEDAANRTNPRMATARDYQTMIEAAL